MLSVKKEMKKAIKRKRQKGNETEAERMCLSTSLNDQPIGGAIIHQTSVIYQMPSHFLLV